MYKFHTTKEKLSLFLIKIKDKSISYFRSFPKKLIHKLAILGTLSIFLTIILTPQIQFQYPQYTMGSIVASNIKADRDFLVEKKAATDQKKMEVLNEILSVYDYDSDVIVRIRANLANSFAYLKENSLEKLIGAKKEDKATIQQIKKSFENYLGVSLSDEEFSILSQNKFSSLAASKISELITSAYDSGMITNVTFLQQE